jgi:uncharacterized protein (UPF0264 family)
MNRRRNRKLLVSVFNPQEAKEAVLGGGRIVDSEDPRSALGNIKPRQIMEISDAVLNYKRNLEVQLSTNIGEDQLLFDRSEMGQAIEKSPYEIAGKAAQSAIGVACAMGTRVHPCNLVKVGVDGMKVELVREVLDEVVLTLNRTEQFSHCQVMSVLFAQNMEVWNDRKEERAVREVLVELREFHRCPRDAERAFDLQDYAVNTLRDRQGRLLFTNRTQVSLDTLISSEVLPDDSIDTYVKLNDLFPHSKYFPQIVQGQKRTNKDVIKAMVDVTADAGVNAIMLDTRIQTKVSRLCLVDTASDGLVDINRFDIKDGLARRGILSLDEIRFFVEYCHYRGIEANVAGSVQSYQAQQLWVKIPELDQISTRGGASAVNLEPGAETQEADTRQHRVIKRTLVRGLAPPEQGGVLNLPVSMKKSQEAMRSIKALCKELVEERRKQDLPDLECFFVDRYGIATPFDYSALDKGGS